MPLHPPNRTLPAAIVLFFGCILHAVAAKGPVPAISIPIEPLGYLTQLTHTPLGPEGVSTLNFVDATHLLLTFSTRSLLTRLPDEPVDDQDRNIAAVLLELPSGKVLARTEWRTHDRRPYLWPLGHGRFLLRLRNRLYTFAPLENLVTTNAFRQEPFLVTQRRIVFVSLSPMADLLTLETLPPAPPKLADDTNQLNLSPQLGDSPLPEQQSVQINFYRLFDPLPGQPMRAVAAGALLSQFVFSLPATAAGYLDFVQESSNTWDFDFYSHTGKKTELAPFDTTCPPRPYFVSPSEFIAFGCRLSEGRPSLGGFNMKGEQMWRQDLAAGVRLPVIPIAPAAGRYALSRALLMNAPADSTGYMLVQPDQYSGQDVVVTQTWSGQELFKIQASPIQRDGQNFDLSADGLSLAVLRNGKIEIYALPALTGKDREEIAKAQALTPAANDAVITIVHEAVPASVPPSEVITVNATQANRPVAASADPETPPTRKPPTLYAPGETPQK